MKRLCKLFIIVAVMLAFSGCSWNEDSRDASLGEAQGSTGGGEVTYQVEEGDLNLNQNNITAYTKQNGILYFLGYIGDNATKQLNYSLMTFDENGGLQQEAAISGLNHYMVTEAAIDTKQSLWVLANNISSMQSSDGSDAMSYLVQIDANGTVLKERSLNDLTKALASRIDYFHSMGSRLSDHALDVVHYCNASYEEANEVFKKAMNHEEISGHEQDIYKGYILVFLGKEYNKHGWVQQYHIGALRNNSEKMLKAIGPDTGFDAIEDAVYMEKLSALLRAQDATDELPKTILYCLNPRDNYALTVLAGCFQKEGIKSRVQVGTAWWFLDQLDGMRQNLEVQMQVAVISQSVGMLTDSRSFLAYPRHEYYRRLLCQMFGNLVESGQYPVEELDTLGKIVEDICYNNAKEFFGF